MSLVMTPQKNVVPVSVSGGDADGRVTNQTLHFSDTINYNGTSYSFSTSTFPQNIDGVEMGSLDPVKLDVEYSTDEDIPKDGITFSINLPEDIYQQGLGGDTNIRNNYFLEYRDDDNDGQTLQDGVNEDPERDGLDEDGDGLDGEEPAVEEGAVGYLVSYFLVPSNNNNNWYEEGGHRYKMFNLIRRLHIPHTGATHFQTLATNIVGFSVVPFTMVGDRREYLSPNALELVWDSTSNEYDYSILNDFSLSFEITIIGATTNGKIISFQRVFRPILFNISAN